MIKKYYAVYWVQGGPSGKGPEYSTEATLFHPSWPRGSYLSTAEEAEQCIDEYGDPNEEYTVLPVYRTD